MVTILTGRVKNASPVSLVLLAKPECGKTSIVCERSFKTALTLSDCTGRGLVELCKYHPEVSHFIINDLIPIFSHKNTVSSYTLAILNSMTEEGIQAMAWPGKVETFEHGKRAVIACCTLEVMNDKRRAWWKTGLASRLLPFAFDHSQNLEVKIKQMIDTEVVVDEKLTALRVPDIPVTVEIAPKMTELIRKLADRRSKLLQDPKGYRRLKQYRTMTKAHALTRTWKQATVTEQDVQFLADMDAYVSYTEAKPL